MEEACSSETSRRRKEQALIKPERVSGDHDDAEITTTTIQLSFSESFFSDCAFAGYGGALIFIESELIVAYIALLSESQQRGALPLSRTDRGGHEE